MKHIVQPVHDEKNNFFFCLYEHATEQALDFFYFEEDAVKRKKFLDSGGAFDGHTPSFVLIRPKINKDVNNEFAVI